MSDNFTIVSTLVGYSVIHNLSHRVIADAKTLLGAKAGLAAMSGFDGSRSPSDSRLGTWRGACKRAIARAEVKA